jgi:polyhydroxybutyrate depolymerase
MKLTTRPSRGIAAAILSVPLFGCTAEPVDTTPPGGTSGTPSVGGSAGGGQAGGGTGGTAGGGAGSGGASAGKGGAGTGGMSGSANAGGFSGGGSGAGGAAAGMSGAGSGGKGGEGGGGMAGASGSSAGASGSGSGSGGVAGGTGGSSGGAPMKSGGCAMATTQMLDRWVESTVMVNGAGRPYSVYLPTGYDPMRAYPVVVLLHGCGSGTNNLPMEDETGADAILIRGTGSAASTCWTTTADGADVAFFDAMVTDVKARFCTDTTRFFAVGYSSGSWLANQLGCIRVPTLRAIATVAGGNPGVRNCGGPIAQIFVHDEGDNSNGISGSESARDRLLTENGCDESIEPVAEDPSPCVRYQGCDPGYPVKWCATTGEGHNRQDNMAAPAFWNFFKEF